MYLSIIILPLLGSIVSGFLGRKLGIKGSQIITTTCVVLTTLLAIIAFTEVSLNHIPVSIHLFRWIDSESLMVTWGFNFDSLTVSMLIPVLIVSSLVHLYSIGYMSNDPHNQRFFSYLSLFTFMMIILVTGNNYLLMFVGWEGVGVCSYLLVSFWFTRIAANQSSLAAFLTNRVGDCFLTIGMFALLLTFGNINYSLVFSLSPYISEDIITLLGILLLLGAMAKSSQIGLHVWLPMAMEGPTPVSALIHAATMVTAGVYLLMRSSPLIEYSSTVLLLCLWIGAITTVFSSLIGLFQQDIKKVIAYSTMSQLGMMVIAVGLSSYNLALFHLVNHAFYKALLFLGAGSVIHAVADNQDFRKYGGLKAFLPLTYSVMLIASLSLVAFPFMTGFYSKDFILESAYGNFSFSTSSVYFIATIGAMFTTLYSVKVLYLTFLTNPNGPQSSYKIAHEGDIFMSLPLIILAVFSIVFGYIAKDLFIGLGSDIFSDNSIFIHPNNESTLVTEFAVPVFFKLLPLAFTISLSLVYIILSEFNNFIIYFKFSRFGYNIYSFFNQRFLIEAFYNKYITDFVLNIGGITTKVIDKGFIELVGPYGLEKGLSYLSTKVENLSTKVVTTYALYILISLMIFIISYYLSDDYASLSFVLPFFVNKSPLLICSSYNNLSNFKSQFSTSAVLEMDNNNNDNDANNDNDNDDDNASFLPYDPNSETNGSFNPNGDNSDSGIDTDHNNSSPRGERIDPSNGHDLDDSYAIARWCHSRNDADEYFAMKKSFMEAVLESGEFQRSREHIEGNIRYLDQQKFDILDEKGWLTAQDQEPNQNREESTADSNEDTNPSQDNNTTNEAEADNTSYNEDNNEAEAEADTSSFNQLTNETEANNGLSNEPTNATENTLNSNDENLSEPLNTLDTAQVSNNVTSSQVQNEEPANATNEQPTVNSKKRKIEETTDDSDINPSKRVKLEEKREIISTRKRRFVDTSDESELNTIKKTKLDDAVENTNSPDVVMKDAPNKVIKDVSKGNGPDDGDGPDDGNGPSASGGGSGGSDAGGGNGSANNSNLRVLVDGSNISDLSDNITDLKEYDFLDKDNLPYLGGNDFIDYTDYISNSNPTFLEKAFEVASEVIDYIFHF